MRRGRRRAFTLTEMVIALAVVAMVLLAAQSAVLLASKAVPQEGSAQVAATRAAEGVQRMLAELSAAKTLGTMESGRIAFTLEDQDADGHDEEIEYAWSGTPGDPLVRTACDGSSEVVVGHVQSLDLGYDTEKTQDPGAVVTTAETTLASCTNLLGLGSFEVKTNDAVAQHMTISLPADATGFIVTRASLYLRSSGSATGVTAVRLRTAWGGMPTGRVVDAASVAESGLNSSFRSVLVSFNGGVVLPPGTPVALAAECESGSPPCEVQLVTLAVALSGQSLLKSTNAGETWSAISLQQMPFTLYGKLTKLDTNATIERCTNVRCTIAAGSKGAASIDANASLLNRPEVP